MLLALVLFAQAGLQQVTRVSQDEPVYSPDGTRILFVSFADGPGNIFVLDAEGRRIVRLTQHALSDDGAIWSPDGARIAYSASDRSTGISEIYLMNAEGSGGRQLTHDKAFAIHPAWSPDGQRILLRRKAATTAKTGDIALMKRARVGRRSRPALGAALLPRRKPGHLPAGGEDGDPYLHGSGAVAPVSACRRAP
jgi:Tol biopolymer transport system component